MRLREKFLRHCLLSTVTFYFETPFWFLSEEIPFESYWNGKIYVICWYSFTQPPDCLGSRALLSHNNVHCAVSIIANAMNRDVRPDRLLRSRNRRETAGTCWRRGCRMETVFSLKIPEQLCLHPVSPSWTKAYSYLLLHPPEFFASSCLTQASMKVLFYSRDFISERRKKSAMGKKATGHLCDHVSEQGTLAILLVSKASLLLSYFGNDNQCSWCRME